MIVQNLKGQYSRVYLDYSVKGTECSELCGVMYVKSGVAHMKGDKGLVYTQCMLAKR